MAAGPYAVRMLFELFVVADDDLAHDGIEATGFGDVLVPEVSGQQIEVAGFAELALVIDYQNDVGREAHHINGVTVEGFVQLGQLEAAAVAGGDGPRPGGPGVE